MDIITAVQVHVCFRVECGSTSGSCKQRRELRRPIAGSIHTVDVVPDIGEFHSQSYSVCARSHGFLLAAEKIIWLQLQLYMCTSNMDFSVQKSQQ